MFQQKQKKKKNLTTIKYSSLVIRRSELIRTTPLLQLTSLRCVHLRRKESSRL